MMNSEYYRELIRPVFAGRKIILATGTVAGAAKQARGLRDFGVEECFVVGSNRGTGELPDREEVGWIEIVKESAPDMLSGLRMYEDALQNPTDEVLAALDAFDPEGEALVLAAHVSDLMSLGGRSRLGARLPEWAALEDKVVIDAFWDRAGIKRAPSKVVGTLEVAALEAAVSTLDRGDGTVWAGDVREGFNGGAEYARRVRTAEDFDEACRFFRAHCDRVRIMPFLEGIACSVHGVVFSDYVACLRPVEMVVFRRPSGARFFYCGFSSWWDPAPQAREHMRQTARQVGEALRREVGYRGAFALDGVMTSEGFFPTELNARTGAAFAGLTTGARDFPLTYVELCVRQGVPLDYKPLAFEELVLQIADAHRFGGGWTVLDRVIDETTRHPLVFEEDRFRLAQVEEEAQATLTLGPSAVGGFISVSPNEKMLSAGMSMAPLVKAAWTFADETFGTGIGPLECAVP